VAISVGRGRSGSVVQCLSGTEPWRPRILRSAGPLARVALVQSRASLLCGDDVALSISVGQGAALELVETAATVVHAAHGGPAARMRVHVRVQEHACLLWLAQPLIVASGARAVRSAALALAGSSRLVLSELVVLGRAREAPGALSGHTRIVCDGKPAVDEALDTADLATLRSPLVAGDATVVAAVTLAGMRDENPPAGTMQAHGPASLWRSSGDAVEVARDAAAVAQRWSAMAAPRTLAAAATAAVTRPARPRRVRARPGADRVDPVRAVPAGRGRR
jgi:urease accessory protein